MRDCKIIFPFSGIPRASYCAGFIIIAALILFPGSPCAARSQSAGNKGPTDTAALNRQIRIALELQDPDSAISLYNKVLQQSTSIGYPDGAFNSLMQMAILYREKDDYQQMQDKMRQAYSWAYKAKRKDAVAWWYNNMSDYYVSQGDYTTGAAYLYKALQEIKKVPGPNITAANINLGLGYLYKLLNQPQKAFALYSDAERICIEGHYDYQLTGVYINKGAYYVDMHRPDSAKWCFVQVMKLAKKQNLTDLVAMANSGMGAALIAAGEYEKATTYLKTAIDLAKTNYHEIALDATYILGDALLHMHRYKEAEDLLLSALNETKSVNTRYNYISCYTKLIKVYKASGQYQKAMDFMDSVAVLKESMMSEENAKAISQMEVKYKNAEKDKKLAQSRLLISKQKNRLSQKNMLIASIICGIGLLVVLFWLRYRSARNKERLQAEQIKALQHENTISILTGIVQGEEKERGRLARELHDGIGGMLSAAMMRFMTMRHSNENIVTMPAYQEAMTMLEEIGDEIRKTAHNLMPASLLKQSLPEAVSSYCYSVQQGSKLQVDFQCYGDFTRFSQNFKLNVYRIVQELLKNIVAHAYATYALVQLTMNDNVLALTIEDNGVGFNKNEPARGIGLHNLQARVAGLHGRCTIESEPGKGTSVFIEFDLEELPNATAYENQDSHSR